VGKAGTIAILLAILSGLGAYNYHRNLEAERAERGNPPFAAYDDASLTALMEAYEGEITSIEGRYGALRDSRVAVRDTHLVGDGVREFERVQARVRKQRAVSEELGTREARVAEIREEQAHRERMARGWVVHVERLIGVSIPL
jgi:hypothetical protein